MRLPWSTQPLPARPLATGPSAVGIACARESGVPHLIHNGKLLHTERQVGQRKKRRTQLPPALLAARRPAGDRAVCSSSTVWRPGASRWRWGHLSRTRCPGRRCTCGCCFWWRWRQAHAHAVQADRQQQVAVQHRLPQATAAAAAAILAAAVWPALGGQTDCDARDAHFAHRPLHPAEDGRSSLETSRARSWAQLLSSKLPLVQCSISSLPRPLPCAAGAARRPGRQRRTGQSSGGTPCRAQSG